MADKSKIAKKAVKAVKKKAVAKAARTVERKAFRMKGWLLGMLLIIAGYAFGIIHKVLNNFNWVTWAYVVGLTLVAIDLALYWRNWRLERTSQDNQKGIENGQT